MLKKEFANENGHLRKVTVDDPARPQLAHNYEAHPEILIGYEVRAVVTPVRRLVVELFTTSETGLLERGRSSLLAVEKAAQSSQPKELGDGVAQVRRLAMEELTISSEGTLNREESYQYDLTLKGPELPESIKQTLLQQGAAALDQLHSAPADVEVDDFEIDTDQKGPADYSGALEVLEVSAK